MIILFPLEFICFDHIECYQLIRGFWKFLHDSIFGASHFRRPPVFRS